MTRFLYSLASVCVAASIASAQVPDIPDLVGVSVGAVVDEPGDHLVFSYTVDNASGTLPVRGISLPLVSDPSRVVVEIDGLDNSGDLQFSSASYRASIPAESYVSVAFPVPANGWVSTFDPDANARWIADADVKILAVGSPPVILTLETRGLPGIRTLRISADIWDLQPSGVELAALGVEFSDLQAEIEASEQSVTTVGPVAPPDLSEQSFFGPITLEIASYVSQSELEGWLSSMLANDYESRLQAIASEFDLSEFESAEAALELLRSDLATAYIPCPDGPGCDITPEGFALIELNVVHLLANIPDQDGDGIADPNDNCLTVSNSDQHDSDGDNYGNMCDGDYNQDGAVGGPDWGIWAFNYGLTVPPGNPAVDHNGDLVIGGPDWGVFAVQYQQQFPGPSGYCDSPPTFPAIVPCD